MRAIVEAAETSAGDIESSSRAEADHMLGEARREAEKERADAKAAAEKERSEARAAAQQERSEAQSAAEKERSEAKSEAERVRSEAAEAARATREKAEADAAGHVAAVEAATQQMRERANTVESDLGGLVDELRTHHRVAGRERPLQRRLARVRAAGHPRRPRRRP